MSDNQFNFLNLKQNLNQEQLEDDLIEKELYKSKNQKGKQFEKFKPKANKDKRQNEKSLKGAENKLKSMLSVFLKNIESEENLNKKRNSYLQDAISDTKKQNKKNNPIKKVKTISVSHKNKSQSNYVRANTLRLSPKKSNFNLNTNNQSRKNKPMSVNKVHFDLKNVKIPKKKMNKKDNISSTYKRTKSFSIDVISKKKLSNAGYENMNSNKKNNYSESNKKITNRISSKTLKKNENQITTFKKLIKRQLKTKTEDHDSFMTDNSNNSLLRKSVDIRNSLIEESKLLKLNGDNNSILSSFIIGDTNKTNIINHSQIYASLLPIDNFSVINKQNSLLDIKDSSEKSVNIRRKRKCSISKKYKRSSTHYSMKQDKNKNNNNSNDKIFRHNTIFKSLKETLKQMIILRPEELKRSSKEITNNKRISNKSIPKNRGKSKFGSNINTPTVDSNFPNNKTENNVIHPPNIISDQKKNLEIENKNKNNESPKIKNVTVFSNNFTRTITRKNTKSYLITKEKYRLLIHKGAVYDSLDDEEIEEEQYNFIYISPNSKFNIIFDGIMFFFSIISLIEVPLYLAKTHDFCLEKHLTFFFGFNVINETLNVIDTFLGFFRAFYNFEEQLITKNSSIIQKYLKSWFIFDLLGSIPIYSINKYREPKCNNFKYGIFYYDNILNNIHYLLIVNRLFKVIKAFSLNQFYKIISNHLIEYQFFSEYGNMLLNIFFITSALNYSACIYIFISRNSYPNWILQKNLHIKNFIDIYICSIYALMMAVTTVGYGDIICYSFNERIFQLILLLVGISAYSWIVTAFSNHIKTINEKYADFEKKKSILDEIKLKNLNLPKELYDRTLRYLKFKNFYDKKDKNLIFDCLPVSLKNNLIFEMYKPIINNFLFFKNFQNTDFIIRVIFSFRPIIAIKNDILINEGEKIEDIMFVKKGVLSLEIPINTENPQENIDKYLNNSAFKIEKGPDLEKVGNTIIADLGSGKFKSSILEKINSNNINNFHTDNSDDKKEKKDNNSYVRILCIRENEHFGDVLMFLGQRSPLRVRVRSKKAELFFLRKIDAVKISSSYKNIWRRINKKSVYNYEQIKKSIKNIIELYCSIKFKNDDTVISIPKKRRTSIVSLRSPAYSLQKPILKNTKGFPLKKSNSDKNIRAKMPLKNSIFPILDKNTINDNENPQSTKDINKLKKNLGKYFSIQVDDEDNDSSSISLSSDNEDKSKAKLIDTYNGKYKYYKSSLCNSKTKKNSIIAEEIGREESLSHIKSGFNKMYSHKKSTKKHKSNKKTDNFSFIKKENKSSSITQKFSNNCSMISKIESENFSDFSKNSSGKDKKNSDISLYKNKFIVNDEIYPGEEFKINSQKSLIPFKKVSDNYSKYYSFNLKKDNNSSNDNLKKLLDDIKCSFIADNKNNISINNIYNNFNCHCQCQCHNHEKINKDNLKNSDNFNNKRKILTTNLSIVSTVNIEFSSLYENLNTLNNKITKDKELQQKIKNLLKSNSAIYPINAPIKISTLEKDYPRRYNKLHTLKSNTLKFSLSLAANQKNSKFVRENSFFKRRSGTFSSFSEKSMNRSLSSHSKIKSSFKYSFSQQKTMNKNKFSVKKCNLFGMESGIKNNKMKNTTIIFPPQRTGKKKISNLLSQINFNIEKTNENLNNPEEFYSNYFQTLLETEKNKEKKSKRRASSLVVRPNKTETLKTKKRKEIKSSLNL